MLKIALSGTLFLFCATVSAMQTQPLDALVTTATRYLADQTAMLGTDDHIVVKRPDRRLKLSVCRQPLAAFLPPGAGGTGHLTVGIRCRGDKPWTVYLSAHIQRFARVLVAVRPIDRGMVVRAADVDMQRQDVSTLHHGYLTEPGDAVGLVAARRIRANRPLAANFLRKPKLVLRGQRVVILAGTTGFQVRMEGEALAAGALGETISVKNLRSKRRVQGVVEGRRRVRVSL